MIMMAMLMMRMLMTMITKEHGRGGKHKKDDDDDNDDDYKTDEDGNEVRIRLMVLYTAMLTRNKQRNVYLWIDQRHLYCLFTFR